MAFLQLRQKVLAVLVIAYVGTGVLANILSIVREDLDWVITMTWIRAPLFFILGVLTTGWCANAYDLLTKLRKPEAVHSPNIIAIACIFSPATGYMLLANILDHLVQHSKEADAKSMRWFYPVSRDQNVNTFTFSAVVSSMVSVLAYFQRPGELLLGLQYRQISGILLLLAIIFGLKIVRMVTKNLTDLVHTVQ